jgi:hypothetical protein
VGCFSSGLGMLYRLDVGNGKFQQGSGDFSIFSASDHRERAI